MTGPATGPPEDPDGKLRTVSTWAGAALVVVVAVVAHHALLSPEGFRTRDHLDFYLRVGQYARELAEGHWPQSLPDALRGGGHAFPLYYPPMAHWAALGVHAAGIPLIPASHLAALLSVLLSGLLQYLLVRKLTGSTSAALFAATCYLVFPYRFQLLQGRGSFAEGWLLAWLPAVVLATRLREPARGLWLPLTLALLFLSHTALSVWALPMIGLLIWVAEPTREEAVASIKGLTRGAVIALGLGMFYFLPVQLGLGLVNASDPVVMRTTAEDVASGELLFSALPYPDVAAGLVSLVVAAIAIRLLRRPRNEQPARRWGLAATMPLLLSTLALAAPVLVWQLAPDLLRYIQSPVRLLGPIGLLVGCIGGFWASEVFKTRPVWLGLLTGVVVLVAAALGRAPQEGRVLASELATLPTSYGDLGFTLEGSYLPKGTSPTGLAERIEATRLGVGTRPLTQWRKGVSGYELRVDAPEGTVVPLPLVGDSFHDVRRLDGGVAETAVVDGQLAVFGSGGPVDLVVRRRLAPGIVPGIVITLATLGLLLAWFHRTGTATGSQFEIVDAQRQQREEVPCVGRVPAGGPVRTDGPTRRLRQAHLPEVPRPGPHQDLLALHRSLWTATWLGRTISAGSFGLALWVGYGKLGDRPPPGAGWASTVMVVLFLGGIQLLTIGTVGEYLGRVCGEVKPRHLYIVARSAGQFGRFHPGRHPLLQNKVTPE